jgi:hypothetical protein
VKVKGVPGESADLGRLELSNVDSLPDLAGVVSLRIKDCPRLRDLSAVARGQVEELELESVVADLGTLAGARLRRLVLAGGRLTDLPVDLPLRSLSVADVPAATEIDHLARLGLTHLEVRQPKPADLVRLRVLTGLREIDLHGVTPSDVLPGRLVRFHEA